MQQYRLQVFGMTEARQFIPVRIAVLTISNTRTLENDVSGQTLADRVATAGHSLSARKVVKDDIPAGVSVAVQPGTNWYYRQFRINLPPYASSGASVFYDITYVVRWDASESASLKRSDILKMLAPMPVRVPILMYHKIGDALYSQYWNTTDMLRAQLAALRAYGYTALTCQELMDIRAGLAPAPAKPILLTFDGGYQNFWLDAIPILMQHDYRAVMFLLMPFIIWMFDNSVSSEISFAKFKFAFNVGMLGLPGFIWKLLALALIWAYLQHFIAGIRHLYMDVNHAVSKEFGRSSALATLVLSLGLTVVLGAKLFGLY